MRAASVFLIFCLVLSTTVKANTLFEGWFEIYEGSKKIGYQALRYEFVDSKFKATSYTRTAPESGDVTESLKAFSASSLSPLNYAYTSKVGKTFKIIDANFKGEIVNLKINDGKKESKETKKVKKGTILSTFLLYLILAGKDGGLEAGKDYSYYAVAEEDGAAYMGRAVIKPMEKVKGRDAFKILNTFKNENFYVWVTPKAEILLVRAPDKNLDVRFADNMDQATNGIPVNKQDLKLLFGTLPGEPKEESKTISTKPAAKSETPKKAQPTETQPPVEIKPPPASSSTPPEK